MEDDSSTDDLLIDVDEEDFALTAEELEQAEEMLGSNTGAARVGAETKEEAKEMSVPKPEIKDKARGAAVVRPGAGYVNKEVKAGQSIEVNAETVPRPEGIFLVHQSPGAAGANEKKVSTVETTKEEPKIGGSKFTVKKVSTRPAGQQPFAFGKSTSHLSNKPAGAQAASAATFTFGNRNLPDSRFGIGQAMLGASPASSMQSARDPRRGNGTSGAPSGKSQARHIAGLSPVSATTSAVAPQAPLPIAPALYPCEPRSSSSIALQTMGPSALERMAAEQEKKCREENMKKEQLEKMVTIKRAKASGQGQGHQVRNQRQPFDY